MKLKRNKISIHQFVQAYPTNEAAMAQFERWRWGDQRRCAHCDSVRVSVAKNQRMPYRCKDCRKRFSPRTGTVMADSNLSYLTWMTAIYIAATGIKGTASTKLASDLGITQKSAWHLSQRIRKAWERDHDILSGVVEVDESYFGGKDRNKHKSKREGRRGPNGKQAVLAIKERGGGVYAKTVNRTDAATLQSEIMEHVEYGSKVYTDDHRAYLGLSGFDHESVKHSVGEYVRDMAHTNGVESFWALLKRGYYGTHHFISAKHLQRYVNEFASRHSVRKRDTIEIMRIVAGGMMGRRLKYRELTA